MYFDKIKKVAKDAIRTVSSKVEEKLLRTEDEEDMIELKSAPDMYDEIDDFILYGKGEDETKKKLENIYKRTAHKRTVPMRYGENK